MSNDDFLKHLPEGVSEHLGYYVYIYSDPRTQRPFYVGKGKGGRALAHLIDVRDTAKTRILTELRNAGLKPKIEVLAHGLTSEETALRIEAAAIDLLGLGALTNAVRGFKSLQMGRMGLLELAGYYAARPIVISHPVLLIRINKLYRHNMLPLELYEATRGIWKLGTRRESVKYALAVFEGVVREVFSVHTWRPERTTEYTTRVQEFGARAASDRWEFLGEVAPKDIRALYKGGSVKNYFKQGMASPTVYVNA
ncbi:MAG: hypothetical protein AAB578_05445 [Elusimicrobiota bacterium]